jgi:hypothetical protein
MQSFSDLTTLQRPLSAFEGNCETADQTWLALIEEDHHLARG